MLKIKDTVDLKFLEQFEFEYDSDTERYCKDICKDRRGAGVTMIINSYDRKNRIMFFMEMITAVQVGII